MYNNMIIDRESKIDTDIPMIYRIMQARGVSATTLWTPLDLGTALAFWVDANETSSITLNGSRVAQWNDLSGNSRHLTQSTSGQEPEWIPGTINEVRTDGINDRMATASFLINQPYARFSVVTRRETRGDNRRVLADRNGSVNLLRMQSTTGVQTVATGTISSAETFSLDQRSQFGEIFNGVSSSLFNNGTATNGTLSANLDGIVIGANLDGFAAGANGLHSVLLINRLPTSDERQRIEGYLAHRYGIQASLPGGHPYLSAPPTK